MAYGQYLNEDPRMMDYSLSPLTRSQSSAVQPPSYGGAISSGYSDAGGVANQAGDAAIASGNPYAAMAGTGAKIIGTGLDIYGKYQQREEADIRHKEALRQYKLDKEQENIDRAREQERLQRQENYFGGEYSQGLEDRFAGSYGGYRQAGG